MKTLTLLVCIVFIMARGSNASVIEDLANQMAPQSWAELNTNNIGIINQSNTCQITEYSSDAAWDPVQEELLFIGGSHYCGRNWLVYEAKTNNWRTRSNYEWAVGRHTYDYNDIDPVNRKFFMFIHRYDLQTGTWRSFDEPPDYTYNDANGATEYFPELGGLVVVYARGIVDLLNESTDRWTRLAQGLVIGGIHHIAEYNPVHKVMFLGGGNISDWRNQYKSVYILDSTGQVTRMKDAPCMIGILQSLVSVDPVTGKFLVLANDYINYTDPKFYEYDHITDIWTELGNKNNVPIFQPLAKEGVSSNIWSTIHTPVSNYGVTMWVRADGNQAWAYLYKHLPLDNTPPTVPQNLTAAAMSDNQIDLSWQASSDPESNITLYYIYRDGNKIGESSSLSFSDLTLTELTQYIYEVTALNGAFLESGKSQPSQSTTLADTSLPTLINVSAQGDPGKVMVSFSEKLEPISAENAANYSIDNGIQINSAVLESDGQTITLHTSNHTKDMTYVLTVNNVTDNSNRRNPILPNTSKAYTFIANLDVTLVQYFGSAASPSIVKDGFVNGAVEANDRSGSQWTNVPAELSGLTYLLTARNDKNSGPAEDQAVYRVNANAPCYVYALIDYGTPSWISDDGWESTGLSVTGDGENYSVYKKYFSAGDIDLKRLRNDNSQGTGFVFELALGIETYHPFLREEQNFPEISVRPNPFNSATTIIVKGGGDNADRARFLQMAVYNLSGQLVQEIEPKENMTFTWNADKYPAGIYILRAKFGQKSYAKMLLLHK